MDRRLIRQWLDDEGTDGLLTAIVRELRNGSDSCDAVETPGNMAFLLHGSVDAAVRTGFETADNEGDDDE